MRVYIVFAHPSRSSFSGAVLERFVQGLRDAGHVYEIGDLYEMGFQSEMDVCQYRRETRFDPNEPLPSDVRMEQSKIDWAEALAFIYPVWWSDCPAKLKGWFDRVLTYGYAYSYDAAGNRSTRIEIAKAVVICSAGHTVECLEETGIAQSMRAIMLNDRLLGVGVKEARMEILGGIMPNDDTFRQKNLDTAYWLGRRLELKPGQSEPEPTT
jgi:NAD(P)H dehydrogenase (quinone)